MSIKSVKVKEYKLDKIRVTFPDGTVINNPTAWKVLAETIIRLDVQNVFNLKIMGNTKHNILLIDTHKSDVPDYADNQMEISPGYYLHTKTNTKQKVAFLEQISEKLKANLKVEIIKNYIGVPQSILDTNISQNSQLYGQVVKAEGVWRFNTGSKPVAKDISTIHFVKENETVAIPFTDHWASDSFIIQHDGKYGIYSLPNLGDCGDDGTLEWFSDSQEAFPYDELRICGFHMSYYGYIAFRIGTKWGIKNAIYSPHEDRINFIDIVECQYPTFEEAQKQMMPWTKPL